MEPILRRFRDHVRQAKVRASALKDRNDSPRVAAAPNFP
jgi:hypothetical protein